MCWPHLDPADGREDLRGTARAIRQAEAIRLCARLEGMLTDPVYEGKSMAALIDLIRDGRIAPGSRVPYAHLGGQPALNGYVGAIS